MKKFLLLLFALMVLSSCDFSNYIIEKETDFTTLFEKSEGRETATYEEVIQFYKALAENHSTITLQQMGETDSGEPLHLVIFSGNNDFDLEKLRRDHSIVLINNGIHPGESDGIDASMMLFRDLAQDSITLPKNTVITSIPIYNIGGALNRNSTTRTNQNGPKEYGFRGNARNYDLNRDFIKGDTRNTRSFFEIFHYVKPDVFIDTHVSNGADYQYTLTHLFTQHNRLGGRMGKYLNSEMMPALEKALKRKNLDITPYVNVFNDVPEKGFTQFMDHPRYSTGYTSLWNTLGMMVETHMLKPYDQRVWGTYELLRSMIDITDEDTHYLKRLQEKNWKEMSAMETFEFNFRPDSTQSTTLHFKGYEASKIKSQVTGLERLFYDRTKPFVKEISYFNEFKATQEVKIPKGYIIPKGWWNVIEFMELNNIKMEVFEKDTTIMAEVYHIEDFETSQNPYEGHYLHSNTKIRSSIENIIVRKGDVYVPSRQKGMKYLLETLEPQASDSFFNWNFFDSILQQKEHFSPYVFEDIAQEFLKENPEIEEEFQEKRKNDPAFSNNWYGQLEWIYKKSGHYESAHLRYPIFRLPR